MKRNLWNEQLSSGSPAQEGSFPPHPRCPTEFSLFSSLTKKKKAFQPWQCCRARVGAGEQVVFDEACTLSATLLGGDF